MTTGVFWLDQLANIDLVGLRRQLAEFHPVLNYLPPRIAILGAAEEGQRLAKICNALDIKIMTIVDDAPKRQGSLVEGQCVQAVSDLDKFDKDIPVIIATHLTLEPYRRLKAKGFQYVSPFAALQVLHGDLFPAHMFYDGWLEDLVHGRARYIALMKRLSDDMSRQTLDAILAYRQTLLPEMLENVTTVWEEVYSPAGLFTLSDDEIYIDGGTYDGDTIRMFVDRTCGNFQKVIGFEPDPTTFHRLVRNFADEPRVVPINAGLWSQSDILSFQDQGGRASILGGEGKTQVKVVTLDETLNGGPCSFIKMNIEGAELEALKGASRTIRKYKPKLAISAYHRPSHLFGVAELVDDIEPGYKLYLRQHCGGVVETVIYALASEQVHLESIVETQSSKN